MVATPDSSVALFYDNTKHLETTDGGAIIYGTVGAAQTALVVNMMVSLLVLLLLQVLVAQSEMLQE